jgi:hypothetical protein
LNASAERWREESCAQLHFESSNFESKEEGSNWIRFPELGDEKTFRFGTKKIIFRKKRIIEIYHYKLLI